MHHRGRDADANAAAAQRARVRQMRASIRLAANAGADTVRSTQCS